MSINAGVKLLSPNGNENWISPYYTNIRIEVKYPTGSGQTSSKNPILSGDIVIDQAGQIWTVGTSTLTGVNIFTCTLTWAEGSGTVDIVPDMGSTAYGIVTTPNTNGSIPVWWDSTYVSDPVARKAYWWNDAKVTQIDSKVGLTSSDSNPSYLLDKLVAGSNVTLSTYTESGISKVRLTSTGGSTSSKVSMTSTDATSDYLYNKLAAGSNVTFELVTNSTGNQSLRINSTGTSTDGTSGVIKISGADTTANFLSSKLAAGSGIYFKTLNSGGSEIYEINNSVSMTPIMVKGVYYADDMDRIISDSVIDEYQTGISYSTDDRVIHNNKIYGCIANGTYGDWDSTAWYICERPKKWESATQYVYKEVVIYNNLYYYCNKTAGSNNTSFPADDWTSIREWEAGQKYYKDEYTEYEGNIYKCTAGYVSGTHFLSSEWKLINSWTTNTNYRKGDMVSRSSNIYSCIKGFMSGDTFSVSNWQELSPWQANTKYRNGDKVFVYSSNTYVIYSFIGGYISGLFFDSNDWELIKVWTANTDYTNGDLITYNGTVYKCISGFTSGTIFNATDWSQVPEWTANTGYYYNQLTVNNNNLYKCTAGYITGTIFNTTDWTAVPNWQSNQNYTRNFSVYYSGNIYRAKSAHYSGTTFDATKWNGPYTPKTWATGQTYITYDPCYYNGYYYVLKDTAGYTSGTTFNGDDWALQTDPGDWIADKSYKNGDVIYHALTTGGTKHFYTCISGYVSGSTFNSSNWQAQTISDTWSTETEYSYGDIVQYLNSYYICTAGYVSSGSFDITKWQQIAIPVSWVSNAAYILGSYVTYNGVVYYCTRSFDGESTFGTPNWTQVPEWTANTDYSLNDRVSYNGRLYECAVGYTSGTVFDASSWDVIPEWEPNTNYLSGDLIVYNKIVYSCIGYKSGDVFDAADWTHINTWSGSPGEYIAGQYVLYNGTVYKALYNMTETSWISGNWEQVSVLGNWASNTSYAQGNVVIYNSSYYVCDAGYQSGSSFFPAEWNVYDENVLAWVALEPYSKGDLVYTGNQSTYHICNQGYTAGSSFNLPDWQEIISYTDWKANTSYINGDVVKYNNAFYVCTNGYVSGETFATADWELITSSGSWISGHSYINGDVVIYNNYTYVCTAGYTTGSFFDQDDWTLIDPHAIVVPRSPSFGSLLVVVDGRNNWPVNAVKIIRNSNKIMNLSEDMTCDVSSSFTMVFAGTTLGWIVY